MPFVQNFKRSPSMKFPHQLLWCECYHLQPQWRNDGRQVRHVLKDLWRQMLWVVQVRNSAIHAEQYKIEL